MLIPFDTLVRKHGVQFKDVLHLGANTGQEASEYARHSAERVFWVEAIPEVFQALQRHLRGFANQTALNACVSDKLGESVLFHVSNNQAQSSSFLELGTHKQEHPTVHYTRDIEMLTTTVESLLVFHEIKLQPGAFLNADLQGAELLALRGMENIMDLFDHAYIEVNEHELYQGCALVHEIDDFLAHHGFVGKEVHMTGSGWGDKYYQRVK